jgi:ATP-dependent protease ClpP protease subunit
MGTPNWDYRENPKRAIYVFGKIGQELIDRLTPTINDLRLSSAEPITAYIDSNGGLIGSAEVLRNLIKSQNPDGGRCKLITVVTGSAKSAAADLLALGDYAIAYDHTEVLYHGSRDSLKEALTSEMASRLARNLEQTNEFFAVRLARCAFARFVLRITQFKDEFQRYRLDPALSILVTALRKELHSANTILLREAMRKQKLIGELSLSVGKHMKRFKGAGGNLSPAQFEAEIFKGVLNSKLKLHKKDGWLPSETGMQEVTNDFQLLHDFHFGSQTRALATLERTYGELVLTDEEKLQYSAMTGTKQEKDAWLCRTSEPRIQPIWYFLVSLCRLLQAEDYELQAREAYWLGLVDEVPRFRSS